MASTLIRKALSNVSYQWKAGTISRFYLTIFDKKRVSKFQVDIQICQRTAYYKESIDLGNTQRLATWAKVNFRMVICYDFDTIVALDSLWHQNSDISRAVYLLDWLLGATSGLYTRVWYQSCKKGRDLSRGRSYSGWVKKTNPEMKGRWFESWCLRNTCKLHRMGQDNFYNQKILYYKFYKFKLCG